jgi:hypothetical protein
MAMSLNVGGAMGALKLRQNTTHLVEYVRIWLIHRIQNKTKLMRRIQPDNGRRLEQFRNMISTLKGC